jgi:hypothetical protein
LLLRLVGGKEMTMNDDEAAILDEISIVPPERKIPLKPKVARPSPFAKRATGPREAPQDFGDPGLDMFTNPGKRHVPPPPPPEEYDGGEEAEDFGPGGDEGFQPGAGVPTPSEGYATIEDEKADLLNKIERLKQKGFKSAARLTSYSRH